MEKAKYHLIGVIAHGIGSWVYTMSDKWKSDANVTIEVLQRVLTAIEQQRGGLPSTLYVQMDNCGRENKNQWVLAYLSWLVQRGVFETIELSFLPVGHTHEDIDQLFSRLAVYLRSHDAIDRTMLYAGIVKAFHQFGQTPICSHLESVACIRSILQPHMLKIGNHGGRAVQHFLFKPHAKGAGMFTKSHSYQLQWDAYGSAERDDDDLAFHLIKPTIPSPPFEPEVRPGPSHPKPLVLPQAGSHQGRDITAHKIHTGLMVIGKDRRVSSDQLESLFADLADFENRAPVPFGWPHDGQFEKERRARAAAGLPPAAAGAPALAGSAAASAAAAAVAAAADPYGRSFRPWRPLSHEESVRQMQSSDMLEADRARLMDSEINKLLVIGPGKGIGDSMSFLSELTPAAKAAATARGITPAAAAAAAAAAAGPPRRGALFDDVDITQHDREVRHANVVRKLFPARLEVGHFLVLKPRLDDHPEVTAAAEAAAAAAAIVVTAPAASSHRNSRRIGRDQLGALRKAIPAAAAAMEEDDKEEEHSHKPTASTKKKKKKGGTGAAMSNKRKSTAAASSVHRPFWVGKVLKFNRNDGWIRFQDWTPYVSREGLNRNKVANAFDGNYFPDVAAGGEPVVQWARWHPDERFLWTFFAESGMSEAGNLVEDVKAHLQQIIQQQPPVRQQLQREKGKGATFPDADWTSAEWPSDNEAND